MKKNNTQLTMTTSATLCFSLMTTALYAGVPLWTFTPTTPTTVAIPANSTGMVQYTVTNQSSRAKKLTLLPTQGLSQAGACDLAPKGQSGDTCSLTININGAQLPEGGVQNGPALCQANPDGSADSNQCYQPSPINVLHVVKLPTLTIGQAFQGGVVACLNGGLNNLIAATADNSIAIEWGGFGTAVGANAQSETDGATNTTAIVTALGNNGGTPYAAELCNNFEVDSQGKTPCQAGNTCYDDWFLPASPAVFAITTNPTSQLDCLWFNRNAIGGFADGIYWSSTESSGGPGADAWSQNLFNGDQVLGSKDFGLPVRCVRAFTP